MRAMCVFIRGSKRNDVVIEYKISNDIKQVFVSQVLKTRACLFIRRDSLAVDREWLVDLSD